MGKGYPQGTSEISLNPGNCRQPVPPDPFGGEAPPGWQEFMKDEPKSVGEPSGGAGVFWQLVAPAAVGVVTGACVAALVAGVEARGLQALAAPPFLLPALFAPLAFL